MTVSAETQSVVWLVLTCRGVRTQHLSQRARHFTCVIYGSRTFHINMEKIVFELFGVNGVRACVHPDFKLTVE